MFCFISQVNGSPANLGNLSEQFRSLTGGTPFVRTYRLLSRCSDKYVQMKLGDKKRAVDAKGLKNSDYGKLLRHIFLFVTSHFSLTSD